MYIYIQNQLRYNNNDNKIIKDTTKRKKKEKREKYILKKPKSKMNILIAERYVYNIIQLVKIQFEKNNTI